MRCLNLILLTLTMVGCTGGFQASKTLSSTVNEGAALLCTPGDQESCNAANGTGTAICDVSGKSWDTCTVKGCNTGYNLQSGACVANLCSPNTQQTCHDGNGTGTQTCNSSGSAWNACGNLTSCNQGYNLQNGGCISDACTPGAQQSCSSGNGTGTQVCNTSGTAWGSCSGFTSCDQGYNLQNGACVANICAPNAQQSCQTGNGTGSQTCNSSGSAWGGCGNLASCNSGFGLLNGACVESSFVLGTNQSKTVGAVVLIMQGDGNLVLYQGSTALWSSGTSGQNCGSNQCYAILQGDGNFVVYDGSTALWNSGTQGNSGDQLLISATTPYLEITDPNQDILWASTYGFSSPLTLKQGQFIKDGSLELVMQGDGNLVLYQGSASLWNSGTSGQNCGSNQCYAVLQGDGNFVVYNGLTALWNLGTQGNSNSTLQLSLQPPYLSVAGSAGQTLWGNGQNLNWFCALDPNGDTDPTRPGAPDYMQLFQPGAPWQNSLQHINVLKIYAGYFLSETDSDLSTIFSFLNANHIALAVEFGAVNVDGLNCGSGVEGSGGSAYAALIAARIQSLGGQLAYVAMDEPMYYEHYNTTPGTAPNVSCQFPIATLAQNIAQTYNTFRQYFPAVQMGDIEPFFAIPPSTWATDYAQFADAFKTATGGVPLAFVHDDVSVGAAWEGRIGSLQALLAQRNIPYGLIRNTGNQGATSDSAWVSDAISFVNLYNSLGLPAPAQNIFQTWETYPTHVLPETSPTTLTYVVNWFFGGI